MPVFCQNCDLPIDEAKDAGSRQACPQCGSFKRRFEDCLSDKVAFGALMMAKGHKGGLSRRKGLLFESKDGDSFCIERKRFVAFSQLVDHENSLYTKKVVDPETGEIIREANESLADHQGYGSAKKRDTTER